MAGETGRAQWCALCGASVGTGDDVVITPDFLADDTDPLWRFSEATMHRACFLLWDERKAFVARFNRVARGFVFGTGLYQHMNAEGSITLRRTAPPPGPTA